MPRNFRQTGNVYLLSSRLHQARPQHRDFGSEIHKIAWSASLYILLCILMHLEEARGVSVNSDKEESLAPIRDLERCAPIFLSLLRSLNIVPSIFPLFPFHPPAEAQACSSSRSGAHILRLDPMEWIEIRC